MTEVQSKRTKRGFVMTGGGAKGLFEAGVIHAFHLCGMEFDVITGSSIGAINSIFYAEYQLRKRALPADVLADPERTIEALDPLIWAFMHAWWEMPRMGIIDDSATGPLGMLKDDMLKLDISLPSLVRLAWWYTDPQADRIPDAQVLADVSAIVNELPERLAGGRGVIEIWRRWRDDKEKPFDAAVRTYLNRFGMEHALVPDDQAERLRDYFTQSIAPLRDEHIDDPADTDADAAPEALIPADRTLRDFKEAGIDVRLTRTNFRTGRLEVSVYNSPDQFAAFLKRHWFRFDRKEGLLPAFGNARLHVLGNPNAVYAALASGRFPGVFSPMPIGKIYDLENLDDRDNVLLSSLLVDWLDDSVVREAMRTTPPASGRAAVDVPDELMRLWQSSDELARLFPRANDRYVDGGAIDNTPTNSAIDAVKDYADENGIGYRDLRLDLYTVFLHPPPDPGELVSELLPSSIETVRRTMEIRTAAVLDTDAAQVRFVNKAAQQSEDASRALISLAAALEDLRAYLPNDETLGLTPEQQAALRSALDARIAEALPGDDGLGVTGRIDKLKDDQKELIDHQMPLHVNPIEIHPEEMPMRTLQFTERLGFRTDNAIRMMTSGCYSTLWSLYAHLLGKQASGLDAQDRSALELASRWMGLDADELPDDKETIAHLHESWRCRRVRCVFHARHCRHGLASVA
jgi:predicted acylesterase/phospholipase RssA